MKQKNKEMSDELLPEYDFDYSKAVRGKYLEAIKKGTNIVILEPDVAKAFRSSAAVNDALRTLLQVSETTRRLTKRTSKRPRKSQATK